jgi:integrase/recombinase XerD
MTDNFQCDETARLFSRLNLADSTMSAYKIAIQKFEQWWFAEDDRTITEVPSTGIEAYLNYLVRDEGYADKTVLKHKQALSTLYDIAESKGGERPRGVDQPIPNINENPVKSVDNANIGDHGISSENTRKTTSDNAENVIYLTREETRKLRESVPAPKLRNRLLLKILIQTGARRNEVSTLKKSDILREKNTLWLEDSKTGEGRKVPYNDLSPELDAWLDKHREKYLNSESDFLFVGERSEQLSTYRVGDVVVEAAENAGIQETLYTDARGREINRVTAHALRHTFAIRALDSGLPIHALKELLGHSDIDTTETYLQITQDDAVDKYHEKDVTFT